MGDCSTNCNPCGPSYDAINQLAVQTKSYARQANTSAVDAANSATNAENSWLEFNALYLGAFASAPTVDNEGNPIQVGALYWNSLLNKLWVWDGAAWEPSVEGELYLGGFAVAPTLNNQGLPLVSGNLYWNTASNNLWAHNGTSWVVTNFNETTNFVATGTLTPRNLVTRSSDVLNILDFIPLSEQAAIKNGTSTYDAYPDIVAAINAALPRQTIFFPKGTYRATSTITIEKGIIICGEGLGSEIRISHTGNGIVFQPAGAGTNNVFLTHAGIKNILVNRGNFTSPPTNIWVRQCNQFVAENVYSYNSSVGIRVSGGSGNIFKQIKIFNSASLFTPLPENALFLIESQQLSGGGWQRSYTITLEDLYCSGSMVVDYGVLIKSVDGFNFVNAYFGECKKAYIGLKRESVDVNITAINISNIYFDTGFTNHAVFCQHSLGSSQYGASNINFSNCLFFNNTESIPNQPLVWFISNGYNINFTGNIFNNNGSDWAVVIADDTRPSETGTYSFTGNYFYNVSQLATGGAIIATNFKTLTLVNNQFEFINTSSFAVLVRGNCGTFSAIGNSTDRSALQIVTIDSAATFTGNVVLLNAGQTTTNIVRLALPTSSAGLPSGAMWNNAGNVQIVP